MAHILEVYRNILKAKIPEKWKKILIDEYNVNHKKVLFYAPLKWYEIFGEQVIDSLYKHTGFKYDVNAIYREILRNETLYDLKLVGYDIIIYFD